MSTETSGELPRRNPIFFLSSQALLHQRGRVLIRSRSKCRSKLLDSIMDNLEHEQQLTSVAFVDGCCTTRSLANNATIGLPALPPEILLQIFYSLKNISDVESLALTNSSIFNVWNAYTDPIINTVLPLQLRCYPEARMLADCQEKQAARKLLLHATNYRKVIRLTHRLLSNALSVSQIESLFHRCMMDRRTYRSSWGESPHPHEWSSHTSESKRFHRAFYRTWTYSVASESSYLPQGLHLEYMPFRQFWPMLEIYAWVAGGSEIKLEEECLEEDRRRDLLLFVTSLESTPDIPLDAIEHPWVLRLRPLLEHWRKLKIAYPDFAFNVGQRLSGFYSFEDKFRDIFETLPDYRWSCEPVTASKSERELCKDRDNGASVLGCYAFGCDFEAEAIDEAEDDAVPITMINAKTC